LPQRQLVFVGSSIDDLRSFPEDVKDVVGYALWLAQDGQKHPDAKPLKGFGGAGVLEIADAYRGDAYRVIYTTTFADVVYVLHAFKKKSTRGIATPKQHIDVIKRRLKDAAEIHGERKPS
jgi:phage-related protein